MAENLLAKLEQTSELTTEQREKVRRLVRNVNSSYLSHDKEAGPFLLYLMGGDLETVAKTSGYGFDIIVMTALHYQWKAKKEQLNKIFANGSVDLALDLQRQMANMMLITSYMAMQNEMAKVLSGQVEASKSSIAVKTLSGINNLVDLIMKLNGQIDANGNAKIPTPAATVIHANNVQINNGKEEIETKESRIDRLKRLENG